MIYTLKNKKYIRIPDSRFMKMIKKYDKLYILFYKEKSFYGIAIRVENKYYFITSETISGLKVKLKYLGLKPSIKLKKEIFLTNKGV